MWKKLISMILAIAFFSLFILNSAEAGSKQRHMWYGAGIALGAVAIGGLLAHHIYTHTPPPPPQVVYYPPPEYVPGHWETIREWVPGTWERVWVPLVTMIVGEIGWQDIMRTARPLAIMLREGFTLKGITEIVKN